MQVPRDTNIGMKAKALVYFVSCFGVMI
jgi:hypothetical protein